MIKSLCEIEWRSSRAFHFDECWFSNEKKDGNFFAIFSIIFGIISDKNSNMLLEIFLKMRIV